MLDRLYGASRGRGARAPDGRGHGVEDGESVPGRFARAYYESGETTWKDTTWLGVQTLKCPLDLWIYQELIHAVRPDLIVETGSWRGGSAHFMACICELLGRGDVVSIDIEPDASRPAHARVRYVVGPSTAPETVDLVRGLSAGKGAVMVVLDSDHRKAHVIEEMRAYGGLVTVGSYLIVEDTCINGHPVEGGFGPGPMEAVEEFLGEDPRFEVDRRWEKFMMTFNPRGFLKRTG